MSNKNTFAETGWFSAAMFVLGAVLGMAIMTDWFNKLGNMSNAGAIFTWIVAIGLGFGAIFLGKYLVRLLK